MIIDVFNHFMPKTYLARLAELVPDHIAVTAFPRLQTLVDVDARLRLLDQFGDFRQVICLANPPLELVAPPAESPELARLANDSLAEVCRKHPDRFPAFIASLPMNNIEASLAEIDRAIGELGARGIQVFTNVAGKPLSAPAFRPIFQLMVKHDLPVWVHPMRGREFRGLRQRAGVGKRDLVQLRMALRDDRMHDAVDLFRDFRRVTHAEDCHASHGWHDSVFCRQD